MAGVNICKYIVFIHILLVGFNAFSEEKIITFSTNPLFTDTTLNKELEPLKAKLQQHGYSLSVIIPKDWHELIANAKKGIPDLVYMGALSSNFLHSEFNYSPILKTVNHEQYVIIQNKNTSDVAMNNTTMYIPKNDLSSNFFAYSHSLKNKETRIKKMESVENILIGVLKNNGDRAIIGRAALDFLPQSLQSKLKVSNEFNYGPIRILTSPSSSIPSKKLQAIIYDLHSNWNQPESKHVYINYYKFEKINSIQDPLSKLQKEFLNEFFNHD